MQAAEEEETFHYDDENVVGRVDDNDRNIIEAENYDIDEVAAAPIVSTWQTDSLTRFSDPKITIDEVPQKLLAQTRSEILAIQAKIEANMLIVYRSWLVSHVCNKVERPGAIKRFRTGAKRGVSVLGIFIRMCPLRQEFLFYRKSPTLLYEAKDATSSICVAMRRASSLPAQETGNQSGSHE
jgi:hypothetical protein